jgi:anti-sigma factor RsiW
MNELIHLEEGTLNEYLDGALTLEQRTALEAHLEVCQHCAQRLAFLQAVFSALESLPEAGLERDLSPRVLAAIGADQSQGGPRRVTLASRLVFVFQAVAAVALLVAIWPFLSQLFYTGIPPLLAKEAAALAQRWSEVWAFWVVDLQASTAGILEELLESWKGLAFRPAWLQASAPEMAVLLVAALALWLAGNGLLVRPQRDGLK